VFKAHRLVYHSILGSRVIKKKKKRGCAHEVKGVGFRGDILLGYPAHKKHPPARIPQKDYTYGPMVALDRGLVLVSAHTTVKARFWPWLSGEGP